MSLPAHILLSSMSNPSNPNSFEPQHPWNPSATSFLPSVQPEMPPRYFFPSLLHVSAANHTHTDQFWAPKTDQRLHSWAIDLLCVETAALPAIQHRGHIQQNKMKLKTEYPNMLWLFVLWYISQQPTGIWHTHTRVCVWSPSPHLQGWTKTRCSPSLYKWEKRRRGRGWARVENLSPLEHGRGMTRKGWMCWAH